MFGRGCGEEDEVAEEENEAEIGGEDALPVSNSVLTNGGNAGTFDAAAAAAAADMEVVGGVVGEQEEEEEEPG